MSDIPVIDPTMTPAWDTLDQLADNFEPDLRKLFADDPNRTQTFTFDAADLHVDLFEEPRVPHAGGPPPRPRRADGRPGAARPHVRG